MKRKMSANKFRVLLLLIFLLAFSCKKGLDERQQLFLEYAKLEDRYRGNGFYRNLDLNDIPAEPVIYRDSAFNVDAFKTSVVKNFTLWNVNNTLYLDLGGYDLQYPHEFTFSKQNDGSVQTDLTVFVPDTYFKFTLDQNDVGKPIMKDSVEVTLLEMTNDGATLLVENKGVRQSFDYTYDGTSRESTKKRSAEKLEKAVGYGKYLFNKEYLESPNSYETKSSDSTFTATFSRLEISLIGEAGKPIISEGRINDFRHYLWYRNHDMPYPELSFDYQKIRSKYIELDDDPNHNFHPLYIVNINGFGKVKKVEFFLRSRNGKEIKIDLGRKIPQTKPSVDKITENEYLPLVNLEEKEIEKALKVNYFKVRTAQDLRPNFVLYASVPYGYNNHETHIYFDNIKMVNSAKDTMVVNDLQNAKTYFEFGNSWNVRNIDAEMFSPAFFDAMQIIGDVYVEIRNYYDKKYNISNLPKGITIAADGVTLNVNREIALLEKIADIYAFDKADAKQPLASFIGDMYEYNETDKIIKYVKKPAFIVVRYEKNDEHRIRQEIPFKLDVKNDELESKKF